MTQKELDQFIKNNFPKVKLATKDFFNKKDGTLIDAYNIAEDNCYDALLYVPPKNDNVDKNCPVFIIAKPEYGIKKSAVYKDTKVNWVNIYNIMKKKPCCSPENQVDKEYNAISEILVDIIKRLDRLEEKLSKQRVKKC